MAEKKTIETASDNKTSEKEIKKETKSVSKTEAKKETKAPAKTAAKPAKPVTKKEVKEEDKVYHIARRKTDHMWYVKAEGSPRALKKFFTQEEAVTYAKTVAGNNEGRIVIHKVDGSFKKLKY